ncbi:MAG: glycoside hydrolase family 9 protein, partial [Candidatus Onthovivens sp.]|nr:glycoside hydrolase family 9 protein [Candidatus Onthovivens sp.]
MAKFKCKMCGAPLNVNEGQTVATCDFCQSKQTVANANDERKENLFNRANSLRAACDFDKAILSYQSILTIFPDEPEAYWGLCLCKYGIEYVNDPVTKKKIPTIHRASYDSILKDSDYLAALSYADLIAKEVYQEEAKQIAEIQQNILSISQKEEPFDIFICYKETTETGKRTRDSVLAQEVYSNLTDKGYKVFFSRITLESKLGSMYEPYIFAALNSAKIMLVFGTKKEYFEAVWVKNEWSRFIDMMKTRPDHYLIPCYRDMDAYEMPEQFLAFQGQDMSKLGFMQDLMRGVDKIMGRLETPKVHAETKIIQSDVNINALLKRAEILIGDGEFTKADEVLEMALNNDPTNSQAYLLKLLIELKYTSIEELKTSDENLESNSNFKKAYKFGDDQQKNILNSINEAINERIEQVKFEKEYEIAIGYKDMKKFLEAKEAFLKLSGFKDSDKQALECVKEVYNQALSLKEEKSFMLAIDLFQKIKEYEDSEFQITDCNELFNKELYDEARQLKESGCYIKAAEIFASLHEYQDAEYQVNECYRLKDEFQKESIYVKCLFNKEINTEYDYYLLKKVCQNLRKIAGYKDADTLLVRYEGILADHEAKLAKKKEEAAKAKAKRIKKAKTISLFSGLGAIVMTAILLLTFLFFVPLGKQNNICNLINAKRYDEAIALIEQNNNFGDSSNLLAMCNAGKEFEDHDYEAGIDYIYNIGGTVDVNYDGNGGTPKISNEQIKKTKGYINNDPNKTAYKNGYNFDNWVLTDYRINAKNHHAYLNLKAQYGIESYRIVYYLNGGTNNPSNPSIYTIEDTITFAAPTKTGYTFLGWFDNNGNQVISIEKGTTGTLTLTACWNEGDSFTITLDANSGSVSETLINVQYNHSYFLPTPTRTGYSFDGWYDGSKMINSSGTWKYTSNKTFIAHWTAVDYSITYNLNGGTNNPSNPSTYTIVDSITFAAPTKTGYTFLGWYSNGTTITEIPLGSTGELNVEARWSANLNSLSVTSEDASKGSVAITSGNGYSGESITVAATSVGDWAFEGWYHDSIKVSDDATYTFIMPTSDYSLVAHFFTKAEAEERRLGITPTISKDGKTITYGLYPQTNVNDSTLISSLNSLTISEANGWYLYDGNYYAKVSAKPYDSRCTFDNRTTIKSGTTYWFKCEPIAWNILSNTNGEYYINIDGIDEKSFSFTIGDDIYDDLLGAAVKYYYYQRSGIALTEEYAGEWAHDAFFMGDLARPGVNELELPIQSTMGTDNVEYLQNEGIEKGWFDAGDYGKYVDNGAYTVKKLLYMYETYPELFKDDIGIPESGNGIPDILDEVAWELDFFLAMQDEDGGIYHSVEGLNVDPFSPENYGDYNRHIADVDGTTGQTGIKPTHTTAIGASALAQASVIYKNIDSEYSEKLLNSALKAWSYLEENLEPLTVTGPAYSDTRTDDIQRLAAASSLYRATGNEK